MVSDFAPIAMDGNNNFVYIYDMAMIQSFFDSGLWLLGYDYVALNDVLTRWNFASLAAPFWRVYWNNAKGASIRIGKRVISLLPDHLYVIPPKVDFGSSHHGNCRQFFIHFQIRHPYTLRGPPIISLPLTKQRKDFVRRIINCYHGNETAQQQIALLIRAFLEILIADLTNQHLIFRKIDKRLLNALTYLEQHLERPIDNQKLAALMHVHPQTLLRLFKSELGSSPQMYLRQLRVDKTSWLLRFSEESIKTIAEATGFCDRYHFTKVFARATGQTPARFRDYKSNYC